MSLPPSASRFLKACRREPVDCTPVWLMRQAGRYLPRYQKLREKYSLLELCKTPELAVQVTLLPFDYFPDLDAAILFSDILLMLEPMGVKLDFLKGEGPTLRNPLRSQQDVSALEPLEPGNDLDFVLETIDILRAKLKTTPLIGFAGAPFTVASYLLEGGHSLHYLATKQLMTSAPDTWQLLMEKLSDAILCYLQHQIKAGVQAVQIFDSWVGALSPEDYRRYVLPYSKKIFDGIRGMAPAIHFGTGTAGFLELMKEAGGDIISIDWRIPLDAAWKRLGENVGIQGNLDPATLFAPLPILQSAINDILARAGGRPGHIFNLGHGVLPHTPVENVAELIKLVHARKLR